MIGFRTRRATARLLLAVLFFAQTAIAFAECETALPGAAQAVAQSSMTCHEPEQNANLCVNHCLASDQSLDKPSLYVPPLSAAVVLVVVSSTVPVESPVASATRAPIAGPPIRILFRSFLI